MNCYALVRAAAQKTAGYKRDVPESHSYHTEEMVGPTFNVKHANRIEQTNPDVSPPPCPPRLSPYLYTRLICRRLPTTHWILPFQLPFAPAQGTKDSIPGAFDLESKSAGNSFNNAKVLIKWCNTTDGSRRYLDEVRAGTWRIFENSWDLSFLEQIMFECYTTLKERGFNDANIARIFDRSLVLR